MLKNKTHIESFEFLSNKSSVIFFQMEILNENKKSSVNKVQYQAFDEQKLKMDYHNVIIQILKYYIILKKIEFR